VFVHLAALGCVNPWFIFLFGIKRNAEAPSTQRISAENPWLLPRESVSHILKHAISNPISALSSASSAPLRFDETRDGDGIDNGVENFFGPDPSAFSSGLVAGAVGVNTFTFTHPQNATPAGDLTAAYQWSKDLATFNADGATDGDNTKVDFTTQLDTPVAGTTTVTTTVSGHPKIVCESQGDRTLSRRKPTPK
jgi:hypothetical protein